MLQRHLVVFARRPQLGVGKRRLARTIGNVEALRFTRSSLHGLLRRLGSDRRWTLWVAATPDRPTDWVGGVRHVAQGQGSLGERLTRVVKRLPPGPVVIIGTDLPTISCRDVAGAFASLDKHAAVLGPATDGGYWLIGLRRRPRALMPFKNVRWSTAHALDDTVAALNGASHALLDLREDVDDAAAMRRLVSARQARRISAGKWRPASPQVQGSTQQDR
jgi:rSAM/selenodomain-associated transferase 1